MCCTSIERELAADCRIVVENEVNELLREFDMLLDDFKTHFQMTLQSAPDNLLANLALVIIIEQSLIDYFHSINALIDIGRRNHNIFRHEFMRLRHTNRMQTGLPREFKQSTTLMKKLKKIAVRIDGDKVNCQRDMKILSSRLTLN